MKGILWAIVGAVVAFVLYAEFIRWIERHGDIQ